jgi:hypothetical protein
MRTPRTPYETSPLVVPLAGSITPSSGLTTPGAPRKAGVSRAGTGLARSSGMWSKPLPPPLNGTSPRIVHIVASRNPVIETVPAQPLVAVVVTVRNGSLPATEKSVTRPMHGVGRCDAGGRSRPPDARIVPGAGAEIVS